MMWRTFILWIFYVMKSGNMALAGRIPIEDPDFVTSPTLIKNLLNNLA